MAYLIFSFLVDEEVPRNPKLPGRIPPLGQGHRSLGPLECLQSNRGKQGALTMKS